jgi:phosphohistidine phosphatase
MKTLFVLRHAKSSWKDSGLADFDRPLNARGLEAAAAVGRHFAKQSIQPDAIISSPAQRAKHTSLVVKEIAPLAAEISYDERVYEASPLTLLVVLTAATSAESILLVGHNPGLEGLIQILTGKYQLMSTACLATVELNISDWPHISAGCGILKGLISS